MFAAEGQVPRVPIFVRKTQFRLPFKSVTPVIMIGPGTGLAPFRGFIQDRHSQKQSGQYLTIIPGVRMGYESIAHEAEGRMGY